MVKIKITSVILDNFLSSESAGHVTRFSSLSQIPCELQKLFHNHPIPNVTEFLLAVENSGNTGSLLTYRYDPGHRKGKWTIPHLNEDLVTFQRLSAGCYKLKLVEYSASHIRLLNGSFSASSVVSEFSISMGTASQVPLTVAFHNRDDLMPK